MRCPTSPRTPACGEIFYDSDDGPADNWTAGRRHEHRRADARGIAADIARAARGGRIGNFAPKLDALAATHVYGTALTDVTTGINWTTHHHRDPGSNDLTRTHGGAFKTTTGFDLATGFGVPIAPRLGVPADHVDDPEPRARPGTHVTLHGVGLERATIKFGAKAAKVLSAGPKSAVVVVPKGTGTVSVSGIRPDRHRQP